MSPSFKSYKLDDVATVDWGNTNITKASYIDNGFPAFSAAGHDGFLPEAEHEGEAIVVSAIGARCGKCFWAEGKWTAIKNTIVIKSKDPEKYDISYLYNLLNDENAWPRSGSGQPFIGIGKAKLINIELPPFPEQKAIARVLRAVQRAKQAREAELTLERERKAALMAHLFTHGTKGEPLKDTPIGPIPESWEVAPFSALCSQRKESIKPENANGLIYVGLEHIDPDVPTLSRCGHPEEVKSSKSHFYSGDILFGKLRPYLKKAVKTDSEGICSTDILVFKPHDDTNPSFLVSLTHSASFIEHAIKTTTGVNHPRTSWASLSQLEVVKPKTEEQKTIGKILSACEQKIGFLGQEVSVLEELFQALLAQLMSGELSVAPLLKNEKEAVA